MAGADKDWRWGTRTRKSVGLDDKFRDKLVGKRVEVFAVEVGLSTASEIGVWHGLMRNEKV